MDDDDDLYEDEDLEFLTLTSWRREGLFSNINSIISALDKTKANTSEIKGVFRDHSPNDSEFFASGERGKREFLFDVVWARSKGDIFRDVLLICEIELARKKDEIMKDFNKLLIGKAPLKFFVFSAPGYESHHKTTLKSGEILYELVEHIKRFRNTEPGECYILYDIGQHVSCIECVSDHRNQSDHLID